MGGKKRLSLTKMQKMQTRKQGRKEAGATKTAPTAKKKDAGLFSPNPKSKDVINELRRMRVLTPYTVASRFDLRLSIAKHFLKSLERQGTIEYVSGGKHLKIYKIPD